MSTIVYLGNTSATFEDNVTQHDDPQITRIAFAREPGSPSIDLIEAGEGDSRDSRERRDRLQLLPAEHRPYFLHLEDIRDLWWDTHAAGPAKWVECDDPALAAAVSHYFGCPIGRPDDWTGPAVHPHDLPGAGAGPEGLPIGPAEHHDFLPRRGHTHNPFADIDWDALGAEYLMTNAGQDAFFAQHLGTSAQPAAFNYVAISANTTAPSTASTTLTGEITTAGGGLVRKQGTYAHTTGTNTGTITATFTANGSDALPVTVAKLGLLNASASGTLGYETLLTSTATLSASGDALTTTLTLTRS